MSFQPDENQGYDDIDDLMPPTHRPKKTLSPTAEKFFELIAFIVVAALALAVVAAIFFGVLRLGRWAISG